MPEMRIYTCCVTTSSQASGCGCGSRAHLLKVDVEGYEKFVSVGARQLLGVTDCVYFETGM